MDKKGYLKYIQSDPECDVSLQAYINYMEKGTPLYIKIITYILKRFRKRIELKPKTDWSHVWIGRDEYIDEYEYIRHFSSAEIEYTKEKEVEKEKSTPSGYTDLLSVLSNYFNHTRSNRTMYALPIPKEKSIVEIAREELAVMETNATIQDFKIRRLSQQYKNAMKDTYVTMTPSRMKFIHSERFKAKGERL